MGNPSQSYGASPAGFKKTWVFFKKPSGFFGFYCVLGFYWVFWGFIGFFLDKQEKIGKIIQKNSVT